MMIFLDRKVAPENASYLADSRADVLIVNQTVIGNAPHSKDHRH